VIPAPVREAMAEHARDESPNEACGLVVLKDGVAERYVAGRNAAESPYRFELDVPPDTWFLEDEGFELAMFHSHLSSPPRPSRTDVENVGLWVGRPYLIYTVRTDELAGWRISSGSKIARNLKYSSCVTGSYLWSWHCAHATVRPRKTVLVVFTRSSR